jgi:hypothetical protein
MSEQTGVAGNTNYRHWDKVTADLVEDADTEEQLEKENNAKALGLDGKYARSHAEAEERKKAAAARKAKKVLDRYQKRELQVMQTFSGVLGDASSRKKGEDHSVVYVTRDMVDAGNRVVSICDTTGTSTSDHIILTQDLSHLESKMASNQMAKEYSENVDNGKPPEPQRSVFGLIKLFLRNVHNCTVILRCKLISGTVEMSHCSNVIVKVEKEATVATLQADLCEDVELQFHDAPSGKNTPGQPTLYWGEDDNDRIFSAGVTNMKVVLYRDGFVDTETSVDYLKDGATAVGNSTAEEVQFVTHVDDGELKTEKVVRHGATTGTNARPMTQRELDAERTKREKAVDMVMEKAIRFEERGEAKRVETQDTAVEEEDDDDVEEIYTSMSKSEIDDIVAECEVNKARGNEAFGAGEYAQAILLYSLALDKADELPDKGAKKHLFPRHVVLANRSAAFLKMGEHEKALADATRAQEIDPTYVKGVFRRGLALHAMGQYQEAINVLAEATKLAPKNKQIKQALQFAEIRMTQEMRKRME